MGLVSELRRRNVHRMAVLYLVAAWLIMQVAEVLIGLVHLPEWIGPTILALLAIGFPIALFFSWFYEITPEGISLEKDVAAGESITHATGRRMDFIVISLLAAAVILFAYDKWWIGPPPEKSIAVMAFENMSGDPEQEYFSDGVSEEILNVLAHIPDLHVTSRSSSFSFKGKSTDIPTIARQLGVATILEGSVRKSGNRVRVTAQLIDASSDKHVWSETYDRDLEDIFALQDEISAAIVGALKEHLELPPDTAPRVIAAVGLDAHDAYLRGRYLIVQRTHTSVQGALREFEKAVLLDPDYALAHAELAMAILLATRRNYGDLTRTEAIARATAHAERAMALAPALAEAYVANGFLLYVQENLEEAETHFKRAIEINPNYSIAYNWMDLTYLKLGRIDEAFSMAEMALHLDPLSRVGVYNFVLKLLNRRRLDEAAREIDKLAVFAPAWAASLRGDLTSVNGNWSNAILWKLEALKLSPEESYTRWDLTFDFAIVGLENEALAISDRISAFTLGVMGRHQDAVTKAELRVAENTESIGDRHSLGLSLASAGDFVRARPILEELWQLSGGQMGWFDFDSDVALIAIRRDAGEDLRVGELLSVIRKDVHHSREAGIIGGADRFFSVNYQEGLAVFLAGEREQGLALISKGVDEGIFIPLKLAYLQTLYYDPGFAPIRVSQEARQAHERKKVLDIVCNDNPYAAVWQPQPETCEKAVESQP